MEVTLCDVCVFPFIPAAPLLSSDAVNVTPINPGDVDDEDEDEGQFQLIQEDVDEEKISLDEFGNGDGSSGRRHTEPARKTAESQEFFNNSFAAADDEWKRLEQEKQADLIAEQVYIFKTLISKVSQLNFYVFTAC